MYVSEQSEPQLMPVGELVTVPEPVPDLVTNKVYGFKVKVAVTFLAASIVRVQVLLVPEQLPDQLVKVEPVSGVTVKVTEVP